MPEGSQGQRCLPAAPLSPIADALRDRPARAGNRRVIAVEGRSGSGKSRIAARLAVELDAPVIDMDDLYPGWEGLSAAVPLVRDWILVPLARGGTPRWRHYDWQHGAYAGWHDTPVRDTLLIQGCGSGARELRRYLCALVWIEAPARLRRERLTARWDWDCYSPHFAEWAQQETAFYAEHRVREHADLIVDNSRYIEPSHDGIENA